MGRDRIERVLVLVLAWAVGEARQCNRVGVRGRQRAWDGSVMFSCSPFPWGEVSESREQEGKGDGSFGDAFLGGRRLRIQNIYLEHD